MSPCAARNALDLYSEGSHFESRRALPNPSEVFRSFPQFLQENASLVPRLGQKRILPDPLQVTISSTSIQSLDTDGAINRTLKQEALGRTNRLLPHRKPKKGGYTDTQPAR
jgi:hypothetical protein